MELLVQKCGDRAVVCLPEELLGLLNATSGDMITVEVMDARLLLKVKSPTYLLADLVAQCDPAVPEPADLSVWRSYTSAGREAW